MQQTSKFWDRVAYKSDGQLGKLTQKLVELSLKHISEDSIILDFGCGNGVLANAFAPKVKKVIGIDISKKMIEAAVHLSKGKKRKNTVFYTMDLLNSHFREESIDVVLAFNVLHYIQDMDAYLKKMNQLLKKNGLLICSTACMKEKRSLIRLFMSLSSKIGLIPPNKWYTANTLEMLIENAKFTSIDRQLISNLPEYFMVFKKA
ncbi:MAG: class I SAM-dependent methyltransferase [Saprospiraceae bacterium]|nr:class I SAM-dependent methyltransferase [Saprospiraceae bacterium]